MKKIALIFGGPSGEHEVSVNSAENIAGNLDLSKYEVHKIFVSKDKKFQFLPDDKKLVLPETIPKIYSLEFNVAIIAIHGEFGEDGQLQAILDSIDLPYVGSDMTASAAAMDKNISNILFEKADLNVPSYIVFSNKEISDLRYPIVIKPVRGGSSVGTVILKDQAGLSKALEEGFRYDDRLMAQEYVFGRELTCGVLENEKGESFALPPTEIIPQKEPFFNYSAKYTPGGSREITPPDLPDQQIEELQGLALKAHNILGCKGISRSDFILSGNKWYILETNTIPGMTKTSLIPQEANAAGINMSKLTDILIQSALNK